MIKNMKVFLVIVLCLNFIVSFKIDNHYLVQDEDKTIEWNSYEIWEEA